ncbi:MAG: NADPH-dependent F420 reductase [Chloroflexi bacterium]|nr:NADPH-dependent F420 reductase [Chloroflexota bacterium]
MIGFLGGTGPEGRGLALRLAIAGQRVMIGSRDLVKAGEAVERIKARAPVEEVLPSTNAHVAQVCDVVFVTVPYEAQTGLLSPLAGALVGKLVVSTVAPVTFLEGTIAAIMVPEGSAAMQAQGLLPQSQVVAAFQNVSAVDLWSPNRALDGDVVVCSDHGAAKARIMAMARSIRDLGAVDGGGLANARYVEELTALLLNINRIHKARTMIRVTGLKGEQGAGT